MRANSQTVTLDDMPPPRFGRCDTAIFDLDGTLVDTAAIRVARSIGNGPGTMESAPRTVYAA
jgi:hypothetical protein